MDPVITPNQDKKEITFTIKINRQLILGLVIGIALGSTVTVLSAKFIGTASNRAGTDNAANPARVITTGESPEANPSAAIPAARAAQIDVADDDHIRGSKDAPVLLVEYSDFECPFCQRHHPTMKNILQKYGDKVAWVYKHFPLSFHPQAMPAALASECASDQGKFWEYADAIFEGQEDMKARGGAFFEDLASRLGLNAGQFKDCFDSQKHLAKVNADYAEGQANGVTGTPGTFVNGVLVSGAVPEAQLASVIEQQLNN